MMQKGVAFILTVCCIVLLAGCAKETDRALNGAGLQAMEKQDTEDANDITESKGDSSQAESVQSDSIQSENAQAESMQTDSGQTDSIQAEIARIEAQSCEYGNADWGRLSDELSPEEKEKILDEQRAWIKRKETRVRGAGAEALGGSLQPQLENDVAKDMTRGRVYILAGYLADVRKESFIIPAEIQESIDMAEQNLDDMFAAFEGQWIFDKERGACVGIERAETCAAEGSKWVVWITGGDILSDQDVYGYTESSILFKVAHDGYTAFYELTFNIDHALVLAYGTSLDAMDDVLIADEKVD